VIFGKRTVKDGECAAIWDVNGKLSLHEGPQRIWISRSNVRFLDLHIANQHQYLEVCFKRGEKEHIPGPASVWLNPSIHSSVKVKDSIKLDSFEALVVYSDTCAAVNSVETAAELEGSQTLPAKATPSSPDLSALSVSRRVLHGPAIFTPSANERVLEFSWHGDTMASEDHPSKTRVLPGQDRFVKLQLLQKQIYYNVRDVLTSDDLALTVKLMISYQCQDVQVMLDSTQDPIGDLVNAVCSDVIAFAASRTYEQFLEQTASLSDMASFVTLGSRARDIGFKVHKVMYRGYKAGAHVESMHDNAVRSRTELKLRAETVQQQQMLQDLELDSSMKRSQKEMEKEMAYQKHQREMEALEHTERLRRLAEEHEQTLKHTQQLNETQLNFYNGLSDRGVELTKYLVAKEQKVDQHHLLQVQGQGEADSQKLQMHIHQK